MKYYYELFDKNEVSELHNLLRVLKKNEKNIPMDVLKTKYKVPYEELKLKIWYCIKVLLIKGTMEKLSFKGNGDKLFFFEKASDCIDKSVIANGFYREVLENGISDDAIKFNREAEEEILELSLIQLDKAS